MKIILFDGVCNLCNSTVNFIIVRDITDQFKFASLQSEYGKKELIRLGLSLTDFSTIILIEGNKVYLKSTAILKIYKELKGYKWTKYFLKLPPSLMDYLYMFISKNRYSFFGKNEDNNSCLLPTLELENKFLDKKK